MIAQRQLLRFPRWQVNWLINQLSAPGVPSIDRLQVHFQSSSITDLKVYLQTLTNTASRFARSWPPSASANSLDYGLQVYVQICSIMASKCISKLARSPTPSSHDHGPQVHLQTCSITASKCISKYPWLPSPSASLNSLDHGLRVYLWVHSIISFWRTSNYSQPPPAASPDILCVDGLQYRYIDENSNWLHEYYKSLND